MNESKLLLGIIIGAAFSGVTSAIASYVAVINDHSGSFFGPASNWWDLAMIIGLVCGIVVGGLSAALIIGLKMGTLKAVLLGGFINLLIVAFFYFLTNGRMDDSIKYWLYALIPIGIINGLIVSFFNSPPNL